MKHFKNKQGQFFGYDDDQIKAGMAKGLTALTDAEVEQLRNPTLSADQLAASLRLKRDAMLSACDWTVLPDCALTTTQKTAWKAYRQALRDVPEQSGFPNTVTWPDAPAGGK